MPTSYVEYQLHNGFVDHWLAAGPQAVPIDLGAFHDAPSCPDKAGAASSPAPPADLDGAASRVDHGRPGVAVAQRIVRHHWQAESGIVEPPVERGPFEAGRFRIGDYSGSWSYYPCPADHFVDCSATYTACHFLRAWAYVEAVSETPQGVLLALTVYGPADVWVDRRHVFRSERLGPDPATLTFRVRLKQGASPILVRFTSLAVRETAHAFALRVCRLDDAVGTGGGDASDDVVDTGATAEHRRSAAEGVHVRFRTLMPRVGRRNAFERLTAAVYLDRDVYEGESPIMLRWPAGPRGACPAHVRLQSADGSIYALADVAGTPGSELHLGSAVQLPAGALRATLMPSPDEVYVGNIRLFHHVPLWSMGRQRHRATPAVAPVGHLDRRRQEALLGAAGGEGSVFAQIARMAVGAWTDVDSAVLLRAIDAINRREDGSNVALLGLLGLLYRWGDHPRFPEDVRRPLERCALGFRYWVDDPGQDVMDFQSEHQRILFHAGEVLAGQRYPHGVFAGGRSGAWHRARGQRLAAQWMTTFGRYGSAEWNAPGAMAHQIAALSHLCDLAEDREVYELAAVALDKLLFTLALHSSQGVIGAAGRTGGADSVKSGLLQPTAGINRLLWGTGIANHHRNGVVSLACATGYEPPPIIAAIAGDAPPEVWSRELHAPPGEDRASVFTYKTPDYILSSVQDYRPGQPGRQELAWRVTMGADATVFASHPGSSSESDSRAPGYWSGNALLPRVAQWIERRPCWSSRSRPASCRPSISASPSPRWWSSPWSASASTAGSGAPAPSSATGTTSCAISATSS